MNKIKNNRVERISNLLNVVKLNICITNNNNKIRFVIKKTNGTNKRPYSYTVPIKFKTLFDGQFEYTWAHYCCHEIAHYIVAAKSRRHKPDYGLTKKPKSFSDLEECKVIAIHNYFLIKFKYLKLKTVFFNMEKFIEGNENKLMYWWNTEGRLLAKTYFELA